MEHFEKDFVFKKTFEYFGGDELATKVWMSKYCLTDNNEHYLEHSPQMMFDRLAKEFYRIENNYKNPLSYDEIATLLQDFKYVIPGGSILYGLGNNYSISSLGNCFSGDTRIITSEGIREIESLVGLKPLLFSENGQWLESEIRNFGNQNIVKLTLIRNGLEKTIETTKEHLWYAKKYRSGSYNIFKTEDLKKDYILKYNLSKNFMSYRPSFFGIAHGFYTGEGSKCGNDRIGKRVFISENKKELIPYFSPLLIGEVEKDITLGGLPNIFKTLPPLNENVSYLYGWLAGYFAADGNIDERGSITISSVNIDNLLWVKEVCSVLGIGTYDIYKQDRISNLTRKPSTIFGIRLMGSTLNKYFFIKKVDKDRFKENMRKSYWRVKNIEYTEIEKPVYCAIVPKTNNFTLEDNILTHNCFVIGNQADSYGGILATDQEQIQLAKRRAGVGHDLSHIRSKGSPITNSSKTSTGIVPFMKRYSNSILEVAQEGRRGALLLSINIDHPEVDNFITAKDKKGEIEGANISVKVTDSFMEDLRNDVPKARKIWDKMVHQAWKSAEPGLLFIDTIQRESPADCYKDFETISTNPCGEIPLCQYDSCRLISINLSSFVIEPFAKVENIFKNFNFNLLDRVAYAAQKLMDDIVDLEYEKIIKILKKVESDPEADEIKAIEKNLWTKVIKNLNRGRRTGLSGIGLADVFASLNIKYDSDEALILAKEIYRHIALASYRSSIDMARDRGSFPDFDYFREQHNPFINRITKGLEKSKVSEYLSFGRRNIANLTVPPSGSISLLGGISSGIEPVFSVVHKRRRKVDDSWEEHLVLHRGFLRWLKSFDSNAGLSDLEIREALKEYSKEDLEKLIKKSPYYNSTAHEIDNNYKIKLQSIIQNWVDHSISVTYNLPEQATESEVSNLMLNAYNSGLKGIAIYRDGSREGILQTLESTTTRLEEVNAPKRPKDLICDIFFPKIKGEEYAIFIGLLNNKPYEVFCFKNYGLLKNITTGVLRKMDRGYYNLLSPDKQSIIVENITSRFEKPVEEFATRIISTALRHGTPVRFVVEQLNKSEGEIFSYSKVISRTLKKYIPDGIKASGVECPECKNNSLIYKSGCVECINCGYSKCS